MCKENGALLNEEPKQQDMFVPQQEEQQEEQLEEQLEQPMMYNAPLQEQQEEQLDPLNTAMIMQENMTERLSKQGTVAASRELERTADAGFQQGIQSRHGACDRRNTTKKKNRARAKLNTQGLSGYSGELSDRLKDNAAQQAEQVQKGSQYRESWRQTGMGRFVARFEKKQKVLDEKSHEYRPVTDEEKERNKVCEIALAGWLKDDKSRANLFSDDAILRAAAAEELVDRLLEFEFKPNATCTIAAVQRAPEVAKYADLLANLRSYKNNALTGKIALHKDKQYDKFATTFDRLHFTTRATVRLQGVNMDGSSLDKFEENTTLWKRMNMRSDRSNYKLDKELEGRAYEENLAEYKRDFLDKQPTEHRLEYIKEETGIDMSEKDYNVMKVLRKEYAYTALEHRAGMDLYDDWITTEAAKNSYKEYKEIMQSKDPATKEKAKTLLDDVGAQQSKELMYLVDGGVKNLHLLLGNDPKLRAAEHEKIMDKLLGEFPRLNPDPAYYMQPANVEQVCTIVDLFTKSELLQNVITVDPSAAEYLPRDKVKYFFGVKDALNDLEKYFEYDLNMRGTGQDGEVRKSGFTNTERAKQKREEHAKRYTHDMIFYNKFHEIDEEQSQRNIAAAKELLGTDLGITKHSLEMAESLREIETGRDAVGQLNEIKGASLRDSRTPRLQAEQQQRMIDKLTQFPLDVQVVSITPEMGQVPKIIAHGKLMDEANKELASNKQTVNDLLPADKLAQMADYTTAFNALRDAAVAIIDREGLTVQGNARYHDMTPQEVAADHEQMVDKQIDQRAKAELLCKDYAAQHLVDDTAKAEVIKAKELLGTGAGVTQYTYRLATELKGNANQQKDNAKANEQWYEAWSKSDMGKTVLATQEKRKQSQATFLDARDKLTKQMTAAKKANNNELAAMFKQQRDAIPIEYPATEEEKAVSPSHANKYAAQLLHLASNDTDRENMMSDKAQLRAEVYTKLVYRMMEQELPADMLTKPEQILLMPTMLKILQDGDELKSLCIADEVAEKMMPKGLFKEFGAYMGAIIHINDQSKVLFQKHGITPDGDRLHKEGDLKDGKDYARFSEELSQGEMDIHEFTTTNYPVAYQGYTDARINKA